MSSMTAHEAFRLVARRISHVIGTPHAFVIAVLAVAVWAASGPMFGYSDTWQLVINTSTTIVTFLVVFLIQNTQNHDAKAIHLKLDELIRAVGSARTGMVDVESLSDEELDRLEHDFHELRETLPGPHSISEKRRLRRQRHRSGQARSASSAPRSASAHGPHAPAATDQAHAATDPAQPSAATDQAHAATDPAHTPTATDSAHEPTATDPAHSPAATDPAHAPAAIDHTSAATATNPAHTSAATDQAHAAQPAGPPAKDPSRSRGHSAASESARDSGVRSAHGQSRKSAIRRRRSAH